MNHKTSILDSQYWLIIGLVLCAQKQNNMLSITKASRETGISKFLLKKWLYLTEERSANTEFAFNVEKKGNLYTIKNSRFTPPPIELLKATKEKNTVKNSRFTPPPSKSENKNQIQSNKVKIIGYGNTKRMFLNSRFTPPPIELLKALSPKELVIFLRFTGQFVKNKNAVMYLYIYILNTCINISIANAMYILIHWRPLKIFFLTGNVSDSKTPPLPPRPAIFGNEKITLMLEAIRRRLGLTYFADPSKTQRMYGRHLVLLYEKHGKEIFEKAFKELLQNSWTKGRCSSIRFLYYNIKPLLGKEPEGSTVESIEDKFNKF